MHPDVTVEPDKDNLVGYVFHTAEIVCVPQRSPGDEHEWELDLLQTTFLTSSLPRHSPPTA